MNPANFQSMAGQGMLPQGQLGAPQPNVQQRANNQAIQQAIYRGLQTQQAQQTLQGWQASVQLPARVHIIFQLVTSLRLIQKEMGIDEVIKVATGFEARTFFGSPDKATYDAQCQHKLAEIAQTRAKVAKSTQQQLQNGQPQINMGQPQAQMQGMAPNPNQFQIPQRFPNNQIARPNQPQAMGIPNQQQQIPIGNPQGRMQAMPQNPPQVNPQGQFTQQEMQEINRLSQHMAQNAGPEQLNHIRSQLENSPQRQHLIAQGIDPLTHFFRQQATRRYLEMKRTAAQRTGQLVQGPNGLNAEQARPISQNSARTHGPQAPPMSAPQSLDPSFMGNMDQIIAQQQNARRLQEAGQVVVPASNVQGMNEQQRGVMSATPQQPTPHNANRQPQTPNAPQQSQAFWNGQNQPPLGQPAGQTSNQPQATNFPNAAAPVPANLQGQIGGLNTPMGRAQQQNTNMPTLTRGVGPQTQTPQPQNPWPQQGTPQMQHSVQVPPQNPQPGNPNGASQRPRAQAGKMNPQLQQYLASLPENERRAAVAQIHQQQQARGGNVAASQPPTGRPQSVAMTAQRSQTGQGAAQATNQAPIQPPGHVINGVHQSNGVQQPQMTVQQPGQSQRPVQQPAQQQGDASQMAKQRQQAALASGSLTLEVERKMDLYGFPPGILNANNALSKLPPDVRTWGQLKGWVKENTASLPVGSEAKLRGLQGLHYQSLSQKIQPNQQQPPGMQPTAPMMPQSNKSAVSAPFQVPTVPQPTQQDIHAAKIKYPQLQPVPDEQVKAMIMKQRHDALRARLNPQQQAQMQLIQQRQQQAQQAQLQQQQQQHQQQLHQQQQQNQPPQNSMQSNQNTQAPPGAQKQQPQPPKQTSQAKAQTTQGKAPQAQMQTQGSNKGVKRPSSDDVVEVPDPKITQQQQRSQATKASQKSSVANMRPTQNTSAAPKQDSRTETEQPMKQAPPPQVPQGNQASNNAQMQQRSAETAQIDARLKELIEEVSRNAHPRQPVPTDLATRHKMVQKLTQVREMIIRMERFMPLFFRLFKDETGTRDLIRTRHVLMAQFKDLNQGIPVDNFTISWDELDKSHHMLHRFYTITMQRMNQEKGKVQAMQNNQGSKPANQPANSQPPGLTAANLQHHDNSMQAERQASVQRSHNNSSRAPQAPTSEKAPYTFGFGAQSPSPHGVPVYGPDLTQANLKLPNKKRKTNPQSGSPVPTPAQGTPLQKPSPLAHKVQSPELQKSQAPAMLKCPVSNCSSGATGFTSQADLDKHKMEAHGPKEPVIEDPLQFALEHIRFGLNLDDNGKAKPKADGNAGNAKAEATTMMKSSSMQGTPGMKQETGTPMSRVPTHTGPSPASHIPLKTPQTSVNIKTPASESKPLPKDPTKDNNTTPMIVTDDPWADSRVSQDSIHNAFSGLSTLNGPKSWTKIQDYYLTPESMSSTEPTDKNSPRPSDVSENDFVKINMDVDMGDKSWIPINWSSDPMGGGLEDLDLGADPFGVGTGMGAGGADMMDWETMFGETVEEAEEKARRAQRRYARDPEGPTEEWLKLYPPR